MTNLVMYDDANVAQFYGPAAQGDAYAGYVDGYVTFPWLQTHFSSKHLMSISIHGADADCLDMENGAAAYSLAPSWFRRAQERQLHTAKPVLYAAAGSVNTFLYFMNQARIPRNQYFVWSAHVGRGPHICGPGTCGEPQADLTQWTFNAWSRSLDESEVPPLVFGNAPPRSLHPTLSLGDKGPAVVTLQDDLHSRGWTSLVSDGDFGPITESDVEQFQRKHKLTVDGIVGPVTWSVLDKK